MVNSSLESFVHKALKDEQIECIHRIVCHGRDLAVLPTGLGRAEGGGSVAEWLERRI